MEHPGVSGCPSALGSGQGALGGSGGFWGLWGFHTHPGRVRGLCCPLALCPEPLPDSWRALGLFWGRGGQEGAGSPSPPGHVPRLPFPAQLHGWRSHRALGPVCNPESCNSQLGLGCTSLVQWYLSLLALSDLITGKKLNLTSCRCPEGTLENSCFSQRLLILHVRRFHSSLPINQTFSWCWIPDSPTLLPLLLRRFLSLCPHAASRWLRG